MTNTIHNMLTTAAAAKRLGVNASRIRQFVLQGRIKATKVGRDLFIAEEELDRFEAEDRDRRVTRWSKVKTKTTD
jgi:excisionase family DNA binding protein